MKKIIAILISVIIVATILIGGASYINHQREKQWSNLAEDVTDLWFIWKDIYK
jgi:Phr family secreted Rap phosphatase inhibitor